MAGLKNKDVDFWNYLKKFDFVGLTETWIDEEKWGELEGSLPTEFVWKCTFATRTRAAGRAAGGIITGARRNLHPDEPQRQINNKEMQCREISIDGEKWKVVTVYNRNGSAETLAQLDELIDEESEGRLIMGGDWNARIGEEGSVEEDGEDRKRSSKDKVLNREGRLLITLTQKRGWYILNGNTEGDVDGELTYVGHQGTSVIDYILVNDDARQHVMKMKVDERCESDHMPITLEIQSQNIERKTFVERERTKTRPKYVWNPITVEKFKQKVANSEFKDGCIEEEVKNITQILRAAATRKNMKKMRKENRQIWWDTECWTKKKEMLAALRKAKRTGRNFGKYRKIKKDFRRLCKAKENQIL